MKKVLLFFALIVLCWTPLLRAENFGNVIEKVHLNAPVDPDTLSYLGLKQNMGQFSLGDIKSDIVIIEVFSFYCPHCQRHAPIANKLYEIIEADQKTKNRVKLIGIGIGNSAYEVELFKKKYTIPFPLFDDGNLLIMDSLTGIRTPSFFAIRNTGGKAEVFFIEQGTHDDPGAFLKKVIEQSGISL
jgi:thiol-disulfide isomerase/thioredoxin